MRVILFKSVDNLGSAGEEVTVKPGYYRNYLGPRGFAQPATPSVRALVQSRRKKLEALVEREREAAKASAGDLSGVQLTFELRANDTGQLFGSVTTADIAQRLAEMGYEIDRRKIELAGQIKALGDYEVRVRLYQGVYATIALTVDRFLTPQEREELEAAEAKAEEVAEAIEEGEVAQIDEEAPSETLEAADVDEAAPAVETEETPSN